MYHETKRYFSAALSLLMIACSEPSEPEAPTTYSGAECGTEASAGLSPDETGPFHIGYRAMEFTYDGWANTGARTITVNIWYPTEAESGSGARYLGLFADNEVIVDAPPAAPLSSCGFPLLVHSHGSQGFGGGGAHVMRRMASHGWVVVAPDHTGNTIADHKDPLPAWFHLARPSDVKKSVDFLRDLPASDPLAQRVATDRYVLTGHSYGSFTAWIGGGATFDMNLVEARCAEESLTCDENVLAWYASGQRDSRVVAIVPMAGSYRENWLGMTGFKTVEVPVLQMTGTMDPVGAEDDWPLFSGIDITWLSFEGGCHETFNLGGCETFYDEEGFALVDTYILAFARYHLLGDRSAAVADIITGKKSLSEGVTYQRKEP